MEAKRSRLFVWARFAVGVALALAIAFGSLAVVSPDTVEARSKSKSTSLSVSCSSSSVNGVAKATIKITVKNGQSGQVLQHPGLGSGSTAMTGASKQVVGPFEPAAGTYEIKLVKGDKVLRRATVTAKIGPGSVSCSSRSS